MTFLSLLRPGRVVLPGAVALAGCNLLLDADPQFTTGAGGSGTSTSTSMGTGAGGSTSSQGGSSQGGGSTGTLGSGGGPAGCVLDAGETWATSFDPADATYLELCPGTGAGFSSVGGELLASPDDETGTWEGHAPGPRVFLTTDADFVALTRVRASWQSGTIAQYRVGGLLVSTPGSVPTPPSVYQDTARWAKWETGDIESDYHPGVLGGWDTEARASAQFFKVPFATADFIDTTLGICRVGGDLSFFYADGVAALTGPVTTYANAGTETGSVNVTGYDGTLEVGLVASNWTTAATPDVRFQYFAVQADVPGSSCGDALEDLRAVAGP